jgi:hypothetical protein
VSATNTPHTPTTASAAICGAVHRSSSLACTDSLAFAGEDCALVIGFPLINTSATALDSTGYIITNGHIVTDRCGSQPPVTYLNTRSKSRYREAGTCDSGETRAKHDRGTPFRCRLHHAGGHSFQSTPGSRLFGTSRSITRHRRSIPKRSRT